jgi:2-oxoglutarate ferredoxin oxidoreductase subunit alpha
MQEANEDAAKLYKSWEKDAKAEEYMLKDAEIVITAYGISARIAKSAVDVLRKEGIKVGLLRPITVHPFPYQAFEHIDYKNIKAVLDVEMSIPAQFVTDVEAGVKDRCPIETCLCSGGNIMSREAVIDAVKKILA